jgi:hypothetical protein
MNPIDKLKSADFVRNFQCTDLVENDFEQCIGYYGIFSDDGQFWAVDILAGIEVTEDGLRYRRKSSGLQYRHFHVIKFNRGIPVVAIAEYRPSCDGRIIGERNDKWLVFTPAYDRPVHEIPKSERVIFKDEGGEA